MVQANNIVASKCSSNESSGHDDQLSSTSELSLGTFDPDRVQSYFELHQKNKGVNEAPIRGHCKQGGLRFTRSMNSVFDMCDNFDWFDKKTNIKCATFLRVEMAVRN